MELPAKSHSNDSIGSAPTPLEISSCPSFGEPPDTDELDGCEEAVYIYTILSYLLLLQPEEQEHDECETPVPDKDLVTGEQCEREMTAGQDCMVVHSIDGMVVSEESGGISVCGNNAFSRNLGPENDPVANPPPCVPADCDVVETAVIILQDSGLFTNGCTVGPCCIQNKLKFLGPLFVDDDVHAPPWDDKCEPLFESNCKPFYESCGNN